ncbi:MAG: archaetidylserine decarboxylase [Thiohalocapsa sp.]
MNDRCNDNGERLGPGQRLFVALQYLLPQHLLSGVVFRLTRLRLGPVTSLLIRAFIWAFRVDMDEAMAPNPAAYPNFNAFFTRALREGARTVDLAPNKVISPVDGAVSQIGRIESGRLFQAKGRDFGCDELLGGDRELAACFDGGLFATLYLSPRDYHRIHMPLDGRLRSTIHVPGRLFSVNPTTAAAVPRLFARNERLVCLFETALGPIALVLVGAIFVGSIETTWSGRVTPPRGRSIKRTPADQAMVPFQRGAELGRFNMGSTVVVLLPPNTAVWNPELAPGTAVSCGRPLALALD